MPVKKNGKKWEVNKNEYDTEAEAIKAYQAYLNAAMGVAPKAAVKKPSKKAKKTRPVDDEGDHEFRDL